MPNKNKIGEKIKTLMEVRNVSLEELANDSDVNIELVEKILNGEIIPSLTPLTKIARVLGVRIGTFIDDDEQTGPLVVRKGKSDKVVYFSGDENKTENSNLEFYSLAAGKSDRKSAGEAPGGSPGAGADAPLGGASGGKGPGQAGRGGRPGPPAGKFQNQVIARY